MYTRRRIARMALGAVPFSLTAAKMDSVFQGIQFGLQSYVFGSVPGENNVDAVIQCMTETKLGEVDLFAPLYEPADLNARLRAARASNPPDPAAVALAQKELVNWRMNTPLGFFRDLRRKFEDSNITIYGISGGGSITSEEEFSRRCEIAHAFGAKVVNVALSMPLAKRLAPIADRSDIVVGLLGYPDMASKNPDAMARPENFEQALTFSKSYYISFDIGDGTGVGYDSLKFVQDFHERIVIVYVKDRKRNNLSVPFGEGDTPIKPVLQWIRDRKYPIRCYLDCDHKPITTRSADVKRSYEYAKAALL